MAKPATQMKLKLLITIWIAFPFVAALKSMGDQHAIRVSEVEREALLSRMMEVALAKRYRQGMSPPFYDPFAKGK